MTEDIIETQSVTLPAHKVSTQIGAEKYGGAGSNASILLEFFINNGAKAAKLILNRVMQLKPSYEALNPEEIQSILSAFLEIRKPCNEE